MIHVQDDGRRGLGVARHAVLHQCLAAPRDNLAIDTVLQTCEGRSTRSVRLGIKGKPPHSQLAYGIAPEALGIMAVSRAGGDLRDTLGHGQTSSDLYGIDRSQALFYQRLGGSLPFFMKYPG